MSNLEKSKISKSFNKAAETYDDNCRIQLKVGQKLIEKISKYSKFFLNVADLGCGTGIITEKLIKELTFQRLTALDISSSLIEKAKARLKPYDLEILIEDFDHTNLNTETQDLIFSNMALQWSLHIEDTLDEINRVLNKNGILAFSIPTKGTYKNLINSMLGLDSSSSYNIFFDYITVLNNIKKSGFKILSTQLIEETKEFSTIYDLLSSIKKTGTSFIKNQSTFKVRNKEFFKKLGMSYPKDTNNKLKLNYNILYCIAKKTTRV